MTKKEGTFYRSLVFSFLIREEPRLDSSKGIVASDLDLRIGNHNTGKFKNIESKEGRGVPSQCQHDILSGLPGGYELVKLDIYKPKKVLEMEEDMRRRGEELTRLKCEYLNGIIYKEKFMHWDAFVDELIKDLS